MHAFETSYQLFHCALAFWCGKEDLCGRWSDGELQSLVSNVPEDEFSHGCAKHGVIVNIQRNCCRELHHCGASTWIGSRFRVFQPVKIQKGVSRPNKLTVSTSLRNTTSVEYKLILMVSESLMRCSSGPVPTIILVTQEDRII